MTIMYSIKKYKIISRVTPEWLMAFFAISLSMIVVILYIKRVVFPDVSFDTLNYHFFLGKSGVENFPKMFKSADFYPIGMHSFNPLIDSIGYIFYKILGYRLGTVSSALSLVLSLALSLGIAYKTLGPKITLTAAVFLLPALVVNEGLFQLATYFTDNIYTFLVLSAIYILMGLNEYIKKSGFVFRMFALGIIFGLLITKLTNLVYVIPMFFVALYLLLLIVPGKHKSGDIQRNTLLCSGILFLLPIILLPGLYFLEAYQATGNPIFPYYNSIFKSIYYPNSSWHFNFGPTTFIERVFYPYYTLVDPNRLGEVKDLFPDLKLIYGILAAMAVFVVLKLKSAVFSKNENILFFITFISYFLWQIHFGFSRYAIALEILVGITLVVLVNKIFLMPRNLTLKLLSIALLVFLSFQSVKILQFNAVYDIAWRPNVGFTEWRQRIVAPELFNKYTVVDSETSSLLKDVEAVVQCANPSSAYAMTIPELMNKPFLNFDIGSNGATTLNMAYVKERDRRFNLNRFSSEHDDISFALVFNNTNPGMNQREICLNAIKEQMANGRELTISKELSIDNFVGDKLQTLTVFLGTYTPTGSF